MRYFKREFVFVGYIPKQVFAVQTPPPSFVLHGEHMLIVLHDSDIIGLDNRLALVVPITSAKAERKRAFKEGRSILESYVPLSPEDYPFLNHESYASTGQICPINREWLDAYIDNIQPAKMEEIDLQVIRNIGLMSTIGKLAAKCYRDQMIVEVETASSNED